MSLPWYASHAAPKSFDPDQGFVEIISSANKRRKMNEDDDQSDNNAKRDADYSQPYTVPELSQDGVPYLLPTVDGFVVSKAAQQSNPPFDPSWLKQKPADTTVYDAYVAAGQNGREKDKLESFSDEMFDLIDARQKLLMQNPRYEFLTFVQGFLQTSSQELLLNQNYLLQFKNLFSSEIAELQKAYNGVVPFAQSMNNLITSNQSYSTQIQSEMAMAVELVMPPIKVLTDPNLQQDAANLSTRFVQMVSDTDDAKKLWQRRLPEEFVIAKIQGETLLPSERSLDAIDFVKIQLTDKELKEIENTLDTIWTRFNNDLDGQEFESNEATRLLKKYSKNVTAKFQVNLNGGIEPLNVTNGYSPYVSGVFDEDGNYFSYLDLPPEAAELVNGSRTLARNPLTFVQYQTTDRSGSSNPTAETRTKLASGLQRFIFPEQEWSTFTTARDTLATLSGDIAKGSTLGEIYANATRLFFLLCTNDRAVLTDIATASNKLKGNRAVVADVAALLNPNRPAELPQTLRYFFRQEVVMKRLTELYNISADLYYAVVTLQLHIYYDLRVAVLLNAYMYQFVHELAGALIQPAITSSLAEADNDRRSVVEAQRQVTALPKIKDFLQNLEMQRKLLAKVARRMDPATSGTFIFAPVLVSAIEAAILDLRTEFTAMDVNWAYFDAMPTLSQSNTPFKAVFARYVADLILSGRVSNSSVIETRESHMHRAVDLKSTVQKISKFRPPRPDRAQLDPPTLVVPNSFGRY